MRWLIAVLMLTGCSSYDREHTNRRDYTDVMWCVGACIRARQGQDDKNIAVEVKKNEKILDDDVLGDASDGG